MAQLFNYVIPGVPAQAAGRKPSKSKPKKPEKPATPITTQMLGEKPHDPLGYDPKIIPVEEIK